MIHKTSKKLPVDSGRICKNLYKIVGRFMCMFYQLWQL